MLQCLHLHLHLDFHCLLAPFDLLQLRQQRHVAQHVGGGGAMAIIGIGIGIGATNRI